MSSHISCQSNRDGFSFKSHPSHTPDRQQAHTLTPLAVSAVAGNARKRETELIRDEGKALCHLFENRALLLEPEGNTS